MRDARAKQPAGAPRTHGPRVHLLGVGPDEVAEGALIWDLLIALQSLDLVQSVDFGREAAVDAQHAPVDHLRAGGRREGGCRGAKNSRPRC
jgi:hypothetical protein